MPSLTKTGEWFVYYNISIQLLFLLGSSSSKLSCSSCLQLCGITITSIYGYIQDRRRRRSSILLELYSSLVRHFFTPITQLYSCPMREKLLRIICFFVFFFNPFPPKCSLDLFTPLLLLHIVPITQIESCIRDVSIGFI